MSAGVVALMPMKGHSERVPEKNFRPFRGKPLFRWTLDALLTLEEIERVVINTDVPERVARDLPPGGRVVVRERKPGIRGDFVSMNLVLADDVGNVPAATYLMTHSTNPLIAAATFRRALAEYASARSRGFDSLFSVNRFQTRFYRSDGSPINHDPAELRRTQDLEPWYEENSCLYVFSRESFRATGARIGRAPLLFETPRFESIDIDDQGSWDLAELLARSIP